MSAGKKSVIRRVFLSFLGTSPYGKGRYRFNDDVVSEPTEFFQESFLQCTNELKIRIDKTYIFLTEEARKKNWVDGGNFGMGLGSRLQGRGFEFESVAIPSGQSETEIREIFNSVYNVIENNDVIYLDITHAFRSIPMLAFSLLNYARFLKKTTNAMIFYGAWEAKTGDISPVFNLTSYDYLLKLSNAVDSFVSAGDSTFLAELLKEKSLPESGISLKTGEKTRKLADALKGFTDSVMTCRGTEIIAGSYTSQIHEACISLLASLEENDPFRPVIEKIQQKTSNFKENSGSNLLEIVSWCIRHNLIQQGITFLQESIITLILMERNNGVFNLYGLREEVKNAFKERSNQKLKPGVYSQQKITTELISGFIEPFKILNAMRNDINHGGMSDGQLNSPEEFRKIINDYYLKFRNLYIKKRK